MQLIARLLPLAVCFLVAVALSPAARAQQITYPGAFFYRYTPPAENPHDQDRAGLTFVISSQYLKNLIEQTVRNAIDRQKDIYGAEATAEIDFDSMGPALRIKLKAHALYDTPAVHNAKIDCTANLELVVENKELMKAKALVKSDPPKCTSKNEILDFALKIANLIGSLKYVTTDGRIYDDYIGKQLGDPEQQAKIKDSYLAQEVLDTVEVGGRVCKERPFGSAYCIDVTWSAKRHREAEEKLLSRLPKPSGAPARPIPIELIKDWADDAPRCRMKTDPNTLLPCGHNEYDGDVLGDMMIYGSLLCTVGIESACKEIEFSQQKNGRWWRSPNHIELPDQFNEFSPDQTLGILNYLASPNVDRAKRRFAAKIWRTYITANYQELPAHGPARVRFYRSCEHDNNGTCNVRVDAWYMLDRIYEQLNLPKGGVTGANGTSNAWQPLYAIGGPKGYGMHLVGVHALVMRKLGLEDENIRRANRIQAARQPENPFFLWLVYGNDQIVEDAMLKYCPVLGDDGVERDTWLWHKDMTSPEWEESEKKRAMRWECLFMAGLLGQLPDDVRKGL